MKKEGKRMVWPAYQKNIADDHYYYSRSCIRQNFYPGTEHTFLRILGQLNKDICDDPRHTTCTGIGYHTDVVPFETAMTVIARHFALMTGLGYENMITSCITSFGLYSEVLETWKEFPESEEKTREYLRKATGREFNIPKDLSHASDIIYKFRKEISALGTHRLTDIHTGRKLRAVEHIGCHYSKMFPSRGVGGAEFPCVLSGLIEEFGGEVVDYPERRLCCGFGFRQYFIKANRGFSVACSKKKFESMAPYEPELILTNCPGCFYFLDRWQYVISEMEGVLYGMRNQGIPVLTYEELAGLVLGYDPWDMGMQMHQIPVEPLLDKMGISYDPEAKYKGLKGLDLGVPLQPRQLAI
ncbi:MAG: heterodisulfide reductase subunit B [Bacteroidales bacterium]|nr:heterodisulfide reductase subunit B [Bacteroidales bacterium]